MASSLLSYYTCLYLCLCAVTISANPHAIRHQGQSIHRRRNEDNSNDENNDDGFAKLDACEALNNCNGPQNGHCVLIDSTGSSTCRCNEGYFGATCDIEPVELMRCTMTNNRMDRICPPGTFCILDNIWCHFFSCTSAKGYCVPEPRLLGIADNKSPQQEVREK